ncbi:uncharacterized protein [Manis javanica]|uniref:uncharacterized protein isoform X1 n=1 Tax=Manis javanica TaxID=9974 RepID=UPI003C6D91AD
MVVLKLIGTNNQLIAPPALRELGREYPGLGYEEVNGLEATWHKMRQMWSNKNELYLGHGQINKQPFLSALLGHCSDSAGNTDSWESWKKQLGAAVKQGACSMDAAQFDKLIRNMSQLLDAGEVSVSLMYLGGREEDLWVTMFPCFSMDPCCRTFPSEVKEPTSAEPAMHLESQWLRQRSAFWDKDGQTVNLYFPRTIKIILCRHPALEMVAAMQYENPYLQNNILLPAPTALNPGNSIEWTWPWTFRHMYQRWLALLAPWGQGLEAGLLCIPGITAEWPPKVTVVYPEWPEVHRYTVYWNAGVNYTLSTYSVWNLQNCLGFAGPPK